MSFDNINLEKGMYAHPEKSFSEVLEELDPSANYRGTELEGMDAFSRQLKRFDIKVSGKNSDPIEKFFRTTDSSVLFPEYISRSVAQGIENSSILDSIIATTTKIDALDAHHRRFPPLQCEGYSRRYFLVATISFIER